MNQELEQITILLKNLIEKMQKPSRLDELTEEIKKIEELKHLFDDDQDKEYFCAARVKSKWLNHLQKCVIMTSQFKILEEYIDLYLTAHPETIDYQNAGGITALMMASANSNNTSTIKTVEILLKHGANIDLQDDEEFTALIYSTIYFNEESDEKNVELLLKYGTNVNLQDSQGKTALTYAAENDNEKVVELLLNNGADIKNENIDCYHGLYYALNTNQQIVELIMNKMENCDIVISNKKLIKYIFDFKFDVKLLKLAIQKGAKITDIEDEWTIKLYEMLTQK